METSKAKTFRVKPVTPLNNETYLPCCYKDEETQQMVWLTDSYEVGRGEEMPSKGVLMLKFSTNFKSHEIKYDPNAPERLQKKAQNQINFFRSFPIISQSMNNGTVNSFPSRNHQLRFANVWSNGEGKDGALSFNDQPFTFIDEAALEVQSLADSRRARKVAQLIDSIADNVGEMINVCYILGINPNGLEKDDIELALSRAILDGDKENDFIAAMDEGKHKNVYLLYTNIAIVRGLIPRSESGYYQIKGEPVSKNIKELALHFQHVEFDWTELKLRLKDIGIIVEEPSSAKKSAAKASSSVTETV